MEAVVASYRRGLKTQTPNQLILYIDGVDNKEKASELVGKVVVWKSPAGKELKGTIRSAHGGKGAVRALFETGIPGQALGTKVEIS